jgi:hypothetical protein
VPPIYAAMFAPGVIEMLLPEIIALAWFNLFEEEIAAKSLPLLVIVLLCPRAKM